MCCLPAFLGVNWVRPGEHTAGQRLGHEARQGVRTRAIVPDAPKEPPLCHGGHSLLLGGIHFSVRVSCCLPPCRRLQPILRSPGGAASSWPACAVHRRARVWPGGRLASIRRGGRQLWAATSALAKT